MSFKILWKFPNQCLRHFLLSFGHFPHTLISYSTKNRGKRIWDICFNKCSGSYFVFVSATFTFITCWQYRTDNRSCRSSLLHSGLWYICFIISVGLFFCTVIISGARIGSIKTRGLGFPNVGMCTWVSHFSFSQQIKTAMLRCDSLHLSR